MEPVSVFCMLAVAVLLLELTTALRRGWRHYRGYVALLGADLALVMWVVSEERYTYPSGAPTVEAVGGLLGCALLVFVPRLLDRLTRRALGWERYDRAARLSAIKELLVPGTVSAAEHALYAQMARSQAGRSAEVIDGLRRQLVEAEAGAAETLQERIITMLLVAGRWREAVIQFETHLGDDLLRAPGLTIQMVRALGELDELPAAARLVERLEARLNPHDAAAQAVLVQARLYLLAAAGDEKRVGELLSLDALKRIHPRLRATLVATARERAAHAPPPHDARLQRFLVEVGDRAEHELRATGRTTSRPAPRATYALIAANVLAYALFGLLLGDTGSLDNLVRGGASYHPAMLGGLDGEHWRLWTAMFLHGGALHIFFNLYGLLLLGRIVEPMLGPARFLVVYAVAGLAGNLLSVYNPNPQVVFSLGASGAVLGLMASLMVMLLLRRGSVKDGWRREVLFNLALLLVVELGLGQTMRNVDNYAHLGGLVGGAALTLFVAPGGLLGERRRARVVVALLLVALAGSAAQSVVSLVREDPAATVARLPRARFSSGGVSLALPLGSERHAADRDEPDELGDDNVLIDYAADLQVVGGAAVGADVTPEAALREAMARDVASLSRAPSGDSQGAGSRGVGKVETAVPPPPSEAQWVAGAQVIPGPGMEVLLLYYARAESPGRVTLVRIAHRHELEGGVRKGSLRGAVLDAEVRQLLASVQVAAPK